MDLILSPMSVAMTTMQPMRTSWTLREGVECNMAICIVVEQVMWKFTCVMI